MAIIHNSLMTPDGTILVSRHRHDYQTYTDANGKWYMVDGGLDYLRRSANGDEIDMSLEDNQPHEVQRWLLRWGNRGKDGKQPLQYKPIAEMDTGHIEAVLDECRPAVVFKNCMEAELKRRKENAA